MIKQLENMDILLFRIKELENAIDKHRKQNKNHTNEIDLELYNVIMKNNTCCDLSKFNAKIKYEEFIEEYENDFKWTGNDF